jgi:hypothetical protein
MHPRLLCTLLLARWVSTLQPTRRSLLSRARPLSPCNPISPLSGMSVCMSSSCRPLAPTHLLRQGLCLHLLPLCTLLLPQHILLLWRLGSLPRSQSLWSPLQSGLTLRLLLPLRSQYVSSSTHLCLCFADPVYFLRSLHLLCLQGPSTLACLRVTMLARRRFCRLHVLILVTV